MKKIRFALTLALSVLAVLSCGGSGDSVADITREIRVDDPVTVRLFDAFNLKDGDQTVAAAKKAIAITPKVDFDVQVVDGQTVCLIPTEPLEYNTTYKVTADFGKLAGTSCGKRTYEVKTLAPVLLFDYSKLTGYSGPIPTAYNISHNSLHTLAAATGAGISGMCYCDWNFLQLMFWIKYASLSADGILQGCLVNNLTAAAAALGIRIEEADRALARISGKENCFAAAVFEKFSDCLAEDRPHVVLHCPGDGGNVGTIIRTCDWFGVHDIVCSLDTADCYNPKVVQATMGALARVRVHYVDLPKWLAEQQIPIVGTLLDGTNMYESHLPQKGIIVMGNEGNGISQEVRKLISLPIRIPSYPKNVETSESLNVSIATAIVLAEFRRA